MSEDDDRWFEIAGLILDGKPVAWDAISGGRLPDDASADALRVIAEVAAMHRAPSGEPARRWGTLAIQELIGHGTFGEVYRARDAALDRDVALKLIDYAPSTTGPDEGRLLARVRHSNVVTVHGAAIHDGRYGIWMEFIRGRTLAAIVREDGPLGAADVTAIGIDVCRALTAVHASGLLHGDIKPQNVMREEGGRIVVMDFGTGRVVSDGAAGDRLAGTPLYLAPEVLTGDAPDLRADVYSAGVLLHYLLTGTHPVEGSTLDEVRAAHAAGTRTAVRSRRPEIPRSLAAIVERALAVEPTDRFESAAAFERALRSFAKRSRWFSRRLAVVIAVSILIAALAGGYWLPSTMRWLASRGLTLGQLRNRSEPPGFPVQFTIDMPATLSDGAFSTPSTQMTDRLHPVIAAPQVFAYRRSALRWMSRAGAMGAIVTDVGIVVDATLSPDGDQVAVVLSDDAARGKLEVFELSHHLVETLSDSAYRPLWSKDGTRLFFSKGIGLHEIHAMRVRYPRNEQILTRVPERAKNSGLGWTSTGTLLFGIEWPGGVLDIRELYPSGESRPLLRTGPVPDTELPKARVSPDGALVAFAVADGLYVQSLSSGARVMVANGSADNPSWRKDGRELFYVANGGLMAATVASDPIVVSEPQRLFDLPGGLFTPSPDGQRFLIRVPVETRKE
jgi:serine/threonine-protein kinase